MKSVDNVQKSARSFALSVPLPSEYTACRNSFPTTSSFFFIFSTGGKVKSEIE